MGKFSPVAQMPRYLQSFQCVGSACIENCCTGWRVTIDKPTYQKYQAIKIEPLASLVHQHIQKCSDGAPDGTRYAAISLKPEQACPFLDEARLCQIHAGMGPQALSNTCSHYPRIYTLEGTQMGVVASLSCPEAARLALLSADAVEMVDVTLPFANAGLVPINRREAAVKAQEPDLVRRHAALLREAMTVVIRQPWLSAAQALVVCGLLLRRVAKVAADVAEHGGNVETADQGLADALEHYLSATFLEQAASQVNGLNVPKEVQAELLMGATQKFLAGRSARRSFKRLIDEVRAGYQENQRAKAAAEPSPEKFSAFDAAHPHVLKNYLLNSLASNLFPRNGAALLEVDFMAMAVRFALIQFYLKALSARPNQVFGLEECVQVVYVVTRNIEHNQSFMPMILKSLEDNDALGMDVLATLVG